MARNYFGFTCTHSDGDCCQYHREGISYGICKRCPHYEQGDSDFEDEDDYNDCYDEQEYYFSDSWWDNNPDAADIADYFLFHDD